MKPIHIKGKDYLLVKTIDLTTSVCDEQCAFANVECPRHHNAGAVCLDYEDEIDHSAHIIKDTPEERAKYIAQMLSH